MKATEINASLIGKNVKHNTTDDILKIFGVAMNDADAHDFSSVRWCVLPPNHKRQDRQKTHLCFYRIGKTERHRPKVRAVVV